MVFAFGFPYKHCICWPICLHVKMVLSRSIMIVCDGTHKTLPSIIQFILEEITRTLFFKYKLVQTWFKFFTWLCSSPVETWYPRVITGVFWIYHACTRNLAICSIVFHEAPGYLFRMKQLTFNMVTILMCGWSNSGINGPKTVERC